MRVLAIILFVTMGCSLVYPAPNMGFAERRIGFAKPIQSRYKLGHLRITNDPKERFARNLNLVKEAKKFKLLRVSEKWNDQFQFCQKAEDARFSDRETKNDETSQVKPVKANEKASSELLSEEETNTNEPSEVAMTTKEVEELLTENVSPQFSSTENNEIAVTDKSTSPDVSNTDQQKYLSKDSDDRVLNILLSKFVDGSTDKLDHLWKKNIVSDPESDSLILTKLFNKVAQDNSDFKASKYSFFNKAAKIFKNNPVKKIIRAKPELLDPVLQSGLSILQFLLTTKADNSLGESQDFKDKQKLSTFKFPLIDKNGKNITDKEALLQALNNKGLKTFKYPLITKSGQSLKNKKDLLKAVAKDLQFFSTKCDDKELTDGEDLDTGAWRNFKNKKNFLPDLFKEGFEASNFPLLEAFKKVLDVPKNILRKLFDKNALSKLQFPKKDLLNGVATLPKFNLHKDLSSLLVTLLAGFKELNFPLTDVTGGMLKNTSDVLQTLLECSPDLAEIQFPLADVAGKVLETKQALLATLTNVNALNALQFPLSDCAGTVFKSKLDFLRSLLKGVITLKFPLTDALGNIFKDVASLLHTFLQSCITLLQSANDLMSDLVADKHELFKTLLKEKGSNIVQILPSLQTSLGNKIIDDFSLNELKVQVKDLVKPIFDADSLSDSKCPYNQTEEPALEKLLPFLSSLFNSDLMSKALPLTAAVEVSVKTKLELLLNLFDPKSLKALIYPLTDHKGHKLKNKFDLIQTIVNGGLASLKFPLTDAAGLVLKDPSKLAELLSDILLLPVENKKATRSISKGIFKLLDNKKSITRLGANMFSSRA